ncbi:beta-lactamase family protein [Mycobacterium sp. CBMA293]|nr:MULTISPECIES: serine hydrolase domain-containing protein [unclassified Mycolicibacterium]MUL58323.1 beta-lactamase family protein [Mycolicibacterium sp. CBMA 335]MUL73781.1 beta-lactamase family protein [Mycolicibacterium sp. CBMA 311]MUL93206.1 beta-lactamase family protein [Mycolicibacterium sp. CBMA 230]MUM07754.1 esterase [Mycolicibacterium sp. CBMA 213]MUM10049.1 beta-lactamase family protein [Mycolicibacterium sp. CBMA 293]
MTNAIRRERNVAPLRSAGGPLPHGVQGAADPNFALVVRAFSAMFPSRYLGGGALSVYLDGVPVVDVWTGWADRWGERPWQADTGATVFSATKGLASTVIHRLADRGLIHYDAPVADYWPAFAANGKAGVTVRQLMRHRAGLSQLNGATRDELMDHRLMERRLAAAPMSWMRGRPAYHAITYGWLLSGLARAVTGQGMRELFRTELAEPLGIDGLYLGRPPADAPTRPAQIVGPQFRIRNPLFDAVAPHLAALPMSGGFGSMYFTGMRSMTQGDTPLLDSEMPGANGVSTARALGRVYGAIANGGQIDGLRFLSAGTVAQLRGPGSLFPDLGLGLPMDFNLGYHGMPFPGVLPGFGHVGLGGSLGWADPDRGLAFGFVHNRLLTPLMVADQSGFVALGAMVRRGVAQARSNGFCRVTDFGAEYADPAPVAG